MKAFQIISCFALALSSVYAAPGTGAHFDDSKTTSSIAPGTNVLTVSFSEAGLGNGFFTYTLSATVTVVEACFNGGDKNPKAQNKRRTSAPQTTSTTLQSRNGRVDGELMMTPNPTGFSCPPGQEARVLSVCYAGITVTDTGNTLSTTAPNVCTP